jgi:hypothetical protein
MVHLSELKDLKKLFFYEFQFITLFPLIFYQPNQKPIFKKHRYLPKKIILRKTFLIVTWLKYLSFELKSRDRRMLIRPLEKKTTHLTLTKAPMAHKTHSKEQFLFKIFHFKITIYSLPMSKNNPLSMGQGLHMLNAYLIKPVLLETSLIWLSYTSLSIPINDPRYFVYF